MLKAIPLLLFVSLLISCEKEEASDSLDNLELAVVECLLLPGEEVALNLHTMIPYDTDVDSEVPIEVPVTISQGATDYILTPVSGSPGHYSSAGTGLTIQAGQTYQLSFTHEDVPIFAETTVPLKPTNMENSHPNLELERIEAGSPPNFGGGTPAFETVEITWDNPDDAPHLVLVEYIENGTADPVNGNLSASDQEDFKKVATDPISGTAHNLNSRMFAFFGNYRIILYRITPEYASLYDNGGSTTLSITEPITNVNNGLGVFSGLNADTLFMTVTEL